MMKNNYLIDFIQKLDFLISEINKLDAKIRLYRRNSSKFGFEFDVKFSAVVILKVFPVKSISS